MKIPPSIPMLILEMKVGVNNSIIYKNEGDHFQFPIFQLRRKNEKLISCTKDIRRKLRTTQSQLHLLVDERAELTAKVSNVLPKTFPENWDRKAPSVGTLLANLETMA